jgi:MoaA/NifB/PqqE/SkfB family radical SAM enzyme
LEQLDSVEEFIEKAASFNSKKHPDTEFTVTSVCTKENFDVLKGLFRRLETERVSSKFQWLKSDGNFSDYPAEIEQFISDKLIENIIQLKEANLYGTLCHSGELFFRIDVDGNVRRCYNAQPLYYLGNILKGTFKPLKEAKPCMAPKCTCTVPANRGMILFGQTAGKYALAKSYCESWIRKLREH